MKTTVTHTGQAHRDEFLACCLLISGHITDRIQRRRLQPGDLEDVDTLVLDQGLKHEPDSFNFDHHQFEADAPASCSITLILELVGVDPELARKVWPWLEFSEWLDAKGPYQTAEKFGMDPDTMHNGVSPIETSMLRKFQSKTVVNKDNPLYFLMKDIGDDKLKYYGEVTKRLRQLPAVLQFKKRHGFYVCDGTSIAKTDQPQLGLEIYLETEQADRDCPVTVTQDDCGDGLCLYRRDDDSRIDFSRLEGVNGVDFAHKNGFVLKLFAGVAWEPMLAQAITK